MRPAPGGVGEAVRLRLGEFSPAERKVARVLLAAYPVAGFETVARLAERAGVSAPTVVRFAQRLGFRGYPEFQQALRDELEEREASPLSMYGSAEFAEQAEAEGGLLAHSGRVFSNSVAETFRMLPQDEIDRAIALVADSNRRITVVGGRFTSTLASYLCLHLVQMRADCRVLPEAPVQRVAMLAELGRRDVVVALDIRRYEVATLRLARGGARPRSHRRPGDRHLAVPDRGGGAGGAADGRGVALAVRHARAGHGGAGNRRRRGARLAR